MCRVFFYFDDVDMLFDWFFVFVVCVGDCFGEFGVVCVDVFDCVGCWVVVVSGEGRVGVGIVYVVVSEVISDVGGVFENWGCGGVLFFGDFLDVVVVVGVVEECVELGGDWSRVLGYLD